MAVLSTSSSLKALKPQVAALIQRGMNVVSTCEELAFPTPANTGLFRELDRLARRKKVSVLSTGVNPGYAMDALALMLTAPCASVARVAVTRVVDAGTRRLPLQRKVGAGLNLNQFRRAMTEGTVRHVGLPESVHMIAAALGWKLDRVDETLEPAIAPRDLDTEYLRIPAGAAAGIKQVARGYRNGELAISLDLQMYVGAESPARPRAHRRRAAHRHDHRRGRGGRPGHGRHRGQQHPQGPGRAARPADDARPAIGASGQPGGAQGAGRTQEAALTPPGGPPQRLGYTRPPLRHAF